MKKILLSILSISLIISCNNGVNAKKSPPAEGEYIGIDISHHQGVVDWNSVAKTDIKFVYHKATEGASHQDRKYRENMKQAKNVGLLVGSYHFYSLKSTATAQFENFKKQTNNISQDLIPVVDVEEVLRGKININDLNLLLQLIENEFQVKPMIYTSERVFYTYFDKPKYKDYLFWISNYKRRPLCRYTLWQCSERFQLSGFKGRVDKNIIAIADFNKILFPKQ